MVFRYLLIFSTCLTLSPCAGKISDPVAAESEGGTDQEGDTNQKADGKAAPDAWPIPDACRSGQVTYGIGGSYVRHDLQSGKIEDITKGLEALSSGTDRWIASSPAGDWFLTSTTRFDPACSDWSCLAVVKGDLSEGKAIKVGGEVLHTDKFGAIASGGALVVYPDKGGPHTADLFVTNLSGSSWSRGVLLTKESPYAYNQQPALSQDGKKVVFDCGEDAYGQPPTNICEVGTDGTGFRVVWTGEMGAVGVSGRKDVALHHPDYSPDGSIVFEADWSGEQIWHLVGDGKPKVVATKYSNDNSPCVMPNGCVVSLWLGRSGNGSGAHEVKTMSLDGENFAMVKTGEDVSDTGISCSQ